jgi:hypothetical protein
MRLFFYIYSDGSKNDQRREHSYYTRPDMSK